MQHRVSNTGEDSQCFVQARIREKWQLQPKIQFNVQFFFLLILVSLRDPKFEWINKKKTSIFCVSFMWYMYFKFYEVLFAKCESFWKIPFWKIPLQTG